MMNTFSESGKKVTNIIRKVIKFFSTIIGQIVFFIIAALLIGILVYIIATIILKDVGKILGIDSSGVKNSTDYQFLSNLYNSGYDQMMPADELIEYFSFEYACLMDAARYLEETGVSEMASVNNSSLDISNMSTISEIIMNDPTILTDINKENGLDINNPTIEDYSRWLWALLNTKGKGAANQNRMKVSSALKGAYRNNAASIANSNKGLYDIANTTSDNGNINDPTDAVAGNGGSSLSNKDSKEEIYYEKVTSEVTGETSLVPYLLIHRDWDRLKYRFYDINPDVQMNPAESLSRANNDAKYIYDNIYALHANNLLNANNVALQPGKGHNNNGNITLSLYEEYPATLYYDTNPTGPATYKIPLKVLIDRYLPKAVLLSAWKTSRNDSQDINDLLDEIKDIYSEACLKGESLSEEKILIKQISSIEDTNHTDIKDLPKWEWQEQPLLERYLDNKNTNITIGGYEPLFDARTLLYESHKENDQTTELKNDDTTNKNITTTGSANATDANLEKTAAKVIRNLDFKQNFESGDLYSDVIDDIKLIFAQHQANNPEKDVKTEFEFVLKDIRNEVQKYIDGLQISVTNYKTIEELTIYRKLSESAYRVECTNEVLLEEEYMKEEHKNPYKKSNYLDCYVPYFKVSVGFEEDEEGKIFRNTIVIIFEPEVSFAEKDSHKKTKMHSFAYKVSQCETGDLTNNSSFIEFERGLAEQSVPLYTNWYSYGKTQELYVITDLIETQSFKIPSQIKFKVTAKLANTNDTNNNLNTETFETYTVSIDVNDDNRQEIIDLFLANSSLKDSLDIIPENTLAIKKYKENGKYNLIPPTNAAPKGATHLPNGEGESEPIGNEYIYLKLKSEAETLTFDMDNIIRILTADYKGRIKNKLLEEQDISLEEASSFSLNIVDIDVDSDSIPQIEDKNAMFIVEPRMCTIGTDVDYKTMPMYFVKEVNTWSSEKKFTNRIILSGKPIEKDNYLYLIQAQRYNNGISDVSMSISAKWRTELYAPIFGEGPARETDILLMISEWKDIANESKENSYAYTYIRDIYKLINYAKGVKDSNGSWLIEPVYKDDGVPYVNYSSYSYLNIEDEILLFDETSSEKAYWFDRILATFGIDAITYQENLEMRNSADIMSWQVLDYKLYPETDGKVYARWPLGGTLGRSTITFDSGSMKGFKTLIDYGSYQGAGQHAGSDWNGRANADKIYQSVFGKSYDYEKPLPEDFQAAITSSYNPITGTVKLHIDKSREKGKDEFSGRFKLSGEPITINLGGTDYTFKSSASAVYGYELYRLTLIYKSPEKAAKLLRAQLEEEIVWTPIIAVAPGYVTDVKASPTGGFSVTVQHSAGIGTYSCHMKRYPVVAVGQYVGAGTTLGYEGTTGNSGGDHIHIEINGEYGIPYLFPMFTSFYYDEKSKGANDELLPLDSEYLTLDRTIYPVKLKTEELPKFLVNEGLDNGRGTTNVNSIESENGEIVIKNYVPTRVFVPDSDLLYNDTDNIPDIAKNREEMLIPVYEEFEHIGGTDYDGELVKTSELYFDENVIEQILSEENIRGKIMEYKEQEENVKQEDVPQESYLD